MLLLGQVLHSMWKFWGFATRIHTQTLLAYQSSPRNCLPRFKEFIDEGQNVTTKTAILENLLVMML